MKEINTDGIAIRDAFRNAAKGNNENMKAVEDSIKRADDKTINHKATVLAHQIADANEERIKKIKSNMNKAVWLYTFRLDMYSYFKGYVFANTYDEALAKVRKKYEKYPVHVQSIDIKELDYTADVVEVTVQL